MKLATLPDPTRDGRLVVVSRDLGRAVSAGGIAPTLQAALEQWEAAEGPLRALAEDLEAGNCAAAEPFRQEEAHAPLPRAYQWLDGSCFKNHGRLMALAMRMDPDIGLKAVRPLMYQGMSDAFYRPHGEILLPREEDQIDFEAEVGIVTDEVPMGTPAGEAAAHVKLVVLLNDVSCRAFAKQEMSTGFGVINCKPSTSFAPVAVTPDALGGVWRDGRLHLPVRVERNGERFGEPNAGEMSFSFFDLIEHAARTRTLCAGTIIGSGTVSNAAYAETGSACIMERRAIETIEQGEPGTGFLRFGERVSVEVRDGAGSVFGRIDQRVARWDGSHARA